MKRNTTPSRTVETEEEHQQGAGPAARETAGEKAPAAAVEAAVEETGVTLASPAEGETQAPPSADAEAAARLGELERDVAQLRDFLMRKQAEFENYRKRVERERQEFAAYAAAELMREILPVVDNLERALSYPEAGSENRLREGVEITYRQFQEVLRKAGLREVDALSLAFDPHVHEAVEPVETAEHAEGTVVEVLQKGYRIGDRLLRPALVKVAKAPESATEPAPTTPTH